MKIKNHNDFGGYARCFHKEIREGANVILVITALALSPLAYGMPSEQKLNEVKPLVDSLIADDMQAMKAKKKSPKDVAVALAAFADKAESEAGKFLLLHKAFCVSARGNIDDYAACVLSRIRNEIADVSAEYIVDLVSKEIRNISAVKSPKVFAIYSEAKRTVDLRRRLATVVSKLKKEPNDKALLRQQAEILASLGNWTRALEIYAKIGSKAARYELDPQSVEGYDLLNAADFWWNYKANDDEPFKAHAAALYRVALDKDVATGLRREMALKRIKEIEVHGGRSGQVSQSDIGVMKRSNKEASPRHGVMKKLTLPGGATIEMIYVGEGEFVMGSNNGDDDEKPSHKVRLSNGFWLGKCEVTQRQWQSVVGGNPSKSRGDDLPVENVSWNDIHVFLSKIQSAVVKDFTGFNAGLPTEAQWEYACRAGTTSDFAGSLDGMAWYSKNSEKKTHPVGMKKANAWGFHDMHGNVWEWCADAYDSSYYGKSPTDNPCNVGDSGTIHVYRGGSWLSSVGGCRSSDRGWNDSVSRRGGDLGFRLALIPDIAISPN